jgi:hypothetical protein
MTARRPQFNRLGQIPWSPTMQVALLTMAIVLAVEYLLFLALPLVPESLLKSIASSPKLFVRLLFLVTLLGNVAAGALAVVIYERWKSHIRLNANILWALIGCLVVALFVRSIVPVMPIFSALSEGTAIQMLIGVFWQGRAHWRRFG